MMVLGVNLFHGSNTVMVSNRVNWYKKFGNVLLKMDTSDLEILVLITGVN